MLDAKNNIESSLGFTVPYTKQDVLELFDEAYENDKMVILTETLKDDAIFFKFSM